MQAPGAVGSFDQISGERVRHVLRFTRSLYPYIVVDLGRACPISLRLLEELSEIYVVTTGGMVEMYETSRVLKRLTSLGFTENQVRMIINRVSGPNFVTRSAIEKALGHTACWTLSDYSGELDSASSACFPPSRTTARQAPPASAPLDRRRAARPRLKTPAASLDEHSVDLRHRLAPHRGPAGIGAGGKAAGKPRPHRRS